ncbi:MAG: hypothetical protein IT445_06335 [Phycisphaeraceae bacterium]|nr:hypothetical protein [Phycisphaeraceae bacterium]
MDVETLARKLRPLMPQQVEHWLTVRQTTDAEFKSLIDRQIIHEGRRQFGDVERRILLSLPPEGVARGPLHLGTVVYEKDKWPFGLYEAELLQGLSIFGRSGSGKTNLIFHLLSQLESHRVVWVLFDWKRTGRHILGSRMKQFQRVNVFTPGRRISPFPFNPFIAPPGLESNVYITHLVDTLAEAYTLGDGARSILHRALAALQESGITTPTTQQVIDQVENMPDTGRVRGWKVSAMRALQSVRFTDIACHDRVTQAEQLRTLLHENTIIELNGLASSAKRFLIPLICLWLYYVKLAAPVRERLDLAICLDEAHHVLYRQPGRAREPLLESLLRQFRELGVAVILSDQNCHLISPAATGNSFASIFLSQKHPSDVNMAAGLCGLEPAEKRYLAMLPVGHGIVKLQDRWHQPFLIRIPQMDIAKGAMTDEKLRDYLKNPPTGPARSAPTSAVPHDVGTFRGFPAADQVLNGDAMAFLEDVIAHPDDGVQQRRQRLKWGGSKASRVQQTLLRQGWLEAQTIPVGNTHKRLLRLSPQGRIALGLEEGVTPRESLAHSYWKRWYARQLADRGYKVQLEAPRAGGRVDVLAVRDHKQIGVEIETGNSDVVANVKHGLRSGFDRVVVVATDTTALAKIQKQLAAAGLMIKRRVIVAMRGEGVRHLDVEPEHNEDGTV